MNGFDIIFYVPLLGVIVAALLVLIFIINQNRSSSIVIRELFDSIRIPATNISRYALDIEAQSQILYQKLNYINNNIDKINEPIPLSNEADLFRYDDITAIYSVVGNVNNDLEEISGRIISQLQDQNKKLADELRLSLNGQYKEAFGVLESFFLRELQKAVPEKQDQEDIMKKLVNLVDKITTKMVDNQYSYIEARSASAVNDIEKELVEAIGGIRQEVESLRTTVDKSLALMPSHATTSSNRRAIKDKNSSSQ